jgi:hypothetical protein
MLVFHTLEESQGTDVDPGFRLHLVEVDAAGALVSETTLLPDAAIDDEFQASWLPDGSGLVAHRLDEGASGLVVWPVAPEGNGPGPVRELGVSLTAGPDEGSWYVLAPDGASALAWTSGHEAVRAPISGEAATPTAIRLDGATSWQRLAQ